MLGGELLLCFCIRFERSMTRGICLDSTSRRYCPARTTIDKKESGICKKDTSAESSRDITRYIDLCDESGRTRKDDPYQDP